MSTQRETKEIVEPFTIFLKARGWHIENIHGNQYQAGLPDLYICHPLYSPRWVECKVFDGNFIHLTNAQKIKFPLLHSFNVPIFIIAAVSLRGTENYSKRIRMYKKLFKEPNVTYSFCKTTHMLLR